MLTLDVFANKTKADPDGITTIVPITDWVDIGFFADADEEELFFKQRVYLQKESQQLTFTLDQLPAKAAIDPLRILIDRIGDDNVKVVSLTEQ